MDKRLHCVVVDGSEVTLCCSCCIRGYTVL